MRFTELGSVLTAFLDNNNIVRYHLLHISFLLTKDGLEHIIIILFTSRSVNIIEKERSKLSELFRKVYKILEV